MFYLLTVVIIATLLERGPTIFASVASVITFAFFFIPHYNSFRVANTEFFYHPGGDALGDRPHQQPDHARPLPGQSGPAAGVAGDGLV